MPSNSDRVLRAGAAGGAQRDGGRPATAEVAQIGGANLKALAADLSS